jgi:hypothetical protein
VRTKGRADDVAASEGRSKILVAAGVASSPPPPDPLSELLGALSLAVVAVEAPLAVPRLSPRPGPAGSVDGAQPGHNRGTKQGQIENTRGRHRTA